MSLRKGDIFIAGAGKDGKDGTNGIDGFSPTVSLTKENNVVTISVTDVNGIQNIDINDNGDILQTQIGSLEALETSDKSSLVNAINEVASTTTTLSSGLKVVEERTTLFNGSATEIGEGSSKKAYFPLNISNGSELQNYDYLEIIFEPNIEPVRYTASGSDYYRYSCTFFTPLIVNSKAITSWASNTSNISIGTYTVGNYTYQSGDFKFTSGSMTIYIRAPYIDSKFDLTKMLIFTGSTYYFQKAEIVGVKVRAVNS